MKEDSGSIPGRVKVGGDGSPMMMKAEGKSRSQMKVKGEEAEGWSLEMTEKGEEAECRSLEITKEEKAKGRRSTF